MNCKSFYDNLIILAIFNFVYGIESLDSLKKFNEPNSKSIAAVDNEVICTYSISLYRRADSSYTATSAVFLNYSPISGLSSISYPQLAGNKTLNFNVKASDSIQVTFSSSIDAFNYGYKIFSEAAGKGQTISYSPLMTTIATIPNSCSSPSCQYSASVTVEQANIVSISVYVNGVAVIYNFSTAILNTYVSENFLVAQDDVIQVVPIFAYIGGQFTFDIAFNDGPNNEGNFFWYFSSAYNGPTALESIQNFCGKTDLILTLSNFSYILGQSVIEIAVVPSFLASSQFQVNLSLICNSTTVAAQNRLSSLDTSQKFNFNLASENVADCYFIASPNDPINYPYADSEKAYIDIASVSFALPSEMVVYRQGAPVPVLLVTSDSSVTTANVAMNCNGIIQSKSVRTGKTSYYTIPIGLYTTCNLTISDLTTSYIARVPTFTIQTQFVPPLGPGFTPIQEYQEAAVAKNFFIDGIFLKKLTIMY